MSKGTAIITALLEFVFNATAMPEYGAELLVNLHTAEPGTSWAGTTAATYRGYAPVEVFRNTASFTVSGNKATNTAEIRFPECTGGTNVITHASVSTLGGQILYAGELPQPLIVNNLIIPTFPVGMLVMQEA